MVRHLLPRKSFQILGLFLVSTTLYISYIVIVRQDKIATFKTNVTFPRKMQRLVLTYPGIGLTNATNTKTSSRRHSILWYKPPGWMPPQWYSDVNFKDCAFRNCIMTREVGDIKSHSAIVFSERLELYPPLTPAERPRDQIWAYYYMEPPSNMPGISGYASPHWRYTINWTMTYRGDSDNGRAYGMLRPRTNTYKADYAQIFARKSKVAVYIASHCFADSWRDEYVRQLRLHGLPVDMYGKCGAKGRINESAKIDMMNNVYKFYLAFENSFCPDYITEKLFENFAVDIVLVVRGGANYSRLLPPETFIDTSKFHSAKALARYLLSVSASKELYRKHLKNRNKYETVSIVEYGSCRLCEKLNNIDDNRNVYEDINSYIYSDNYACFEPTDIDIRQYYLRWLIGIGLILFYLLLYIKCSWSQM